jgi:F-type H+-transporting ATPase subunit epsilon
MAESFQFDLVSPERSLLSGPVEMVTVPGMEGDFGVLKGHAPFMSTLRPGFVEVTRGQGEAIKVFVTGGFADVTPAGLTLLADEAHEAAAASGALFDRLVDVARKEGERTADAHAKARAEQRVRDLELLRAQLRV